jgi:hypothetical protein
MAVIDFDQDAWLDEPQGPADRRRQSREMPSPHPYLSAIGFAAVLIGIRVMWAWLNTRV